MFSHFSHLSKLVRDLGRCHLLSPPVVLTNFNRYEKPCHKRKMTAKSRRDNPESYTVDVVDLSQDQCSNLFSFCKLVSLDKLNAQEKMIHYRHLEALQRGDETYIDPATGYTVLSRLTHLRRGKCCGNACRHCPYGQTGVPEGIPKKTYNSAYFA